MVRFIDLTDQIKDDEIRFAFYDTIDNTFFSFNGSQTWTNHGDFENDYDGDDIERFENLIPNDFFDFKLNDFDPGNFEY